MHRVRYLLLAYTCDLDNDNFSDARQRQTSLYHKFRDLTLLHTSLFHILPMTDCASSRGAMNAIKLFWKTSMIFPSSKRDLILSLDLARRKTNCFGGRMHKRDSRARLNVSQYKRNRRATCVLHFLLLMYALASFVKLRLRRCILMYNSISWHYVTRYKIRYFSWIKIKRDTNYISPKISSRKST